MAEVLYKYLSSDSKGGNSLSCIRWLGKNECNIFNEHLDLCGQAAIPATLWDEIYDEGTIYAGLFVNGKMVARACVEKYSVDFAKELMPHCKHLLWCPEGNHTCGAAPTKTQLINIINSGSVQNEKD